MKKQFYWYSLGLVLLISAANLNAYTFKIRNSSNRKLTAELKTSLAGSPKKKVKLGPGKTESVKFGGLYAGACLTPSQIKINGEKAHDPVSYTSVETGKDIAKKRKAKRLLPRHVCRSATLVVNPSLGGVWEIEVLKKRKK